jgi:hypothetical protein
MRATATVLGCGRRRVRADVMRDKAGAPWWGVLAALTKCCASHGRTPVCRTVVTMCNAGQQLDLPLRDGSTGLRWWS